MNKQRKYGLIFSQTPLVNLLMERKCDMINFLCKKIQRHLKWDES